MYSFIKFYHTLKFANSAVKDELDKLDEATKIELKMLPTYVGDRFQEHLQSLKNLMLKGTKK